MKAGSAAVNDKLVLGKNSAGKITDVDPCRTEPNNIHLTMRVVGDPKAKINWCIARDETVQRA